jgi:hypothetical protein
MQTTNDFALPLRKLVTEKEKAQRRAEIIKEDREFAMENIMGMRYVPFIQALTSERECGVSMLPDFVREVKVEKELDPDETEQGDLSGLKRQYAYNEESPELASMNRELLRYMSVAEFLEQYPCTLKLTRGDYLHEKKMQMEEMWLARNPLPFDK